MSRCTDTTSAAADAAFRRALALDPTALATWFCLYKIHTYSGDLDAALDIALGALREAARQTNLATDWADWRAAEIRNLNDIEILNATSVTAEWYKVIGRRWAINFRAGFSNEERIGRDNLYHYLFDGALFYRF